MRVSRFNPRNRGFTLIGTPYNTRNDVACDGAAQ